MRAPAGPGRPGGHPRHGPDAAHRTVLCGRRPAGPGRDPRPADPRPGGTDPGGSDAMKVLFTTWAWPSHFFPMVPLAWALRSAGHEVRIASGPELERTIRDAGLPAVAVGGPVDIAGPHRAQHHDSLRTHPPRPTTRSPAEAR